MRQGRKSKRRAKSRSSSKKGIPSYMQWIYCVFPGASNFHGNFPFFPKSHSSRTARKHRRRKK